MLQSPSSLFWDFLLSLKHCMIKQSCVKYYNIIKYLLVAVVFTCMALASSTLKARHYSS